MSLATKYNILTRPSGNKRGIDFYVLCQRHTSSIGSWCGGMKGFWAEFVRGGMESRYICEHGGMMTMGKPMYHKHNLIKGGTAAWAMIFGLTFVSHLFCPKHIEYSI